MTMVPGPQRVDVFDLKLRGSFGRFKTDASYTLHYLSTTLRIDQIVNLKVAADVFDISNVNFDELIQRDIDHSRVLRIAEGYLQMGANRAIFFPPLLICLAVMNDQDELKSTYSSVEPQPIHDETLRTIYDGDGFQVDLYQAEAHAGGRVIDWQGQPVHFHDYAAMLGVNSRRTKLIVLDGQHRLRALTHLYKKLETRHVVADIEQPVCIVWMPRAVDGYGEEIVKDLRELFVTVNTEPQRVSGHFILLLNDTSNAAEAVRSLADHWKKIDDGGWSRLHLLEWNTRENQSTDQRQRPFSITTVSIVAKVLEEYLFKAPRLAPAMLRLTEVEGTLEQADPNFDATGLRDQAAPLRVRPIIEAQIDQHLTPALDYLLRKLRPYREVEARLAQAIAKLNASADRGIPGSIALRMYLNRYVYVDHEMFEEEAQAAWAAFKSNTQLPDADLVFSRRAFQQGYLRLWLTLQREMVAYGVDALTAAKATVAASDAFATMADKRYLTEEQPYTRRVLWKNGIINFSPAWARDAWADIQLAANLRDDVRDAVIAEVGAQVDAVRCAELRNRLANVGKEAAQRYTSVLEQEIMRDVKRNLADFFGEAQAGNLRDLRKNDPAAFEEEVGSKAKGTFESALSQLAVILNQEPDNLRPVE